MEYQEALEFLTDFARAMMNEDRRDKMLILLEMMSDVILEDEIVRDFFRDIRSEMR